MKTTPSHTSLNHRLSQLLNQLETPGAVNDRSANKFKQRLSESFISTIVDIHPIDSAARARIIHLRTAAALGCCAINHMAYRGNASAAPIPHIFRGTPELQTASTLITTNYANALTHTLAQAWLRQAINHYLSQAHVEGGPIHDPYTSGAEPSEPPTWRALELATA
jgi:hypothetical protein